MLSIFIRIKLSTTKNRMPIKDMDHSLEKSYRSYNELPISPLDNENTPFINPIILFRDHEGNDSETESDNTEHELDELQSIDDISSIIKNDELNQLKEMLHELANATYVLEDIVQILKSIQDELCVAKEKKTELTACVKSYRIYLKLKYNK